MSVAPGVVREATREDIPQMQRIRRAVRENRLVSTVITDEDVRDHIERRGRGWVVDTGSALAAFAVADATDGSIWALFVDPDLERRGYGRALLDVAVAWLRGEGLSTIWLTTALATRAERVYRAAGWRHVGDTETGEARFELDVRQSGGRRG
jgi:GNAT superfamily N-acetyltransferase